MSGHYKIAWLCEALLVSRSGYHAWIKRRRFPGPRQLENMRLRERIREEFVRSRQTYGSPRLAQVLGCPGRRNRIARLMRLERIFARNDPNIVRSRQTVVMAARSLQIGYVLSWCSGFIRSGSPMPLVCSPVKAGYTWSPFWISLAGA